MAVPGASHADIRNGERPQSMKLFLSLIVLSSGLLAAPLWGSQKTAAVGQSLTEVAPASQARVTDWSYSADRGRLEMTTQGPTRPKLFILQDPPRIVVDLPNTVWDRDPEEVTASGRVESIRISQLNDTMTRFVMTVTPDQPLSLSQLQLQTASPERWAVQFTSADDLTLPSPPEDPAPATLPRLETPTAAPAASPPPLLSLPSPRPTPSSPPPLLSFPSPTPAPLSPIVPSSAPPSLVQPSPAATPLPLPRSTGNLIDLLQVTPTEEGFFVKTSGAASANVRRIADPDRIIVDFLNTGLSPSLQQRSLTVNRLGVSQLRIGQFEPTIARVVLDVDPTAGDWETRYDATQGGVWIVPAGGRDQASLVPQPPSDYDGPLATISAVQLQGNQLVIKADGFLFYRSGWDPESGGYRISVAPARLPISLPDPGLPADGPVDRIRFVQETENSVSILVQPTRDFNVIEPNPGQGSRQITLLLQWEGQSTPPPVAAPPSNPILPGVAQGIVAIDAGHGGRDPGAIGVGGIQEKGVTLNISKQVEQLLLAEGIGVVMTRTDDREILLQPRVDTAVAANAAILVSIHANALDRSGVQGIETYYLRPDSTRLAETMHQALIQGSGATDRGIRRARFFMVRETPTTMPSVLLELGYLTNPTEGSKLATPEYQTQLARAIAAGIKAYLQGQTP